MFKWRQLCREGKLLLPSTDLPPLLPVAFSVSAGPQVVQSERPAEGPEILNTTCEVALRYGTLRLNDTVSEKLLILLIQELKR